MVVVSCFGASFQLTQSVWLHVVDRIQEQDGVSEEDVEIMPTPSVSLIDENGLATPLDYCTGEALPPHQAALLMGEPANFVALMDGVQINQQSWQLAAIRCQLAICAPETPEVPLLESPAHQHSTDGMTSDSSDTDRCAPQQPDGAHLVPQRPESPATVSSDSSRGNSKDMPVWIRHGGGLGTLLPSGGSQELLQHTPFRAPLNSHGGQPPPPEPSVSPTYACNCPWTATGICVPTMKNAWGCVVCVQLRQDLVMSASAIAPGVGD